MKASWGITDTALGIVLSLLVVGAAFLSSLLAPPLGDESLFYTVGGIAAIGGVMVAIGREAPERILARYAWLSSAFTVALLYALMIHFGQPSFPLFCVELALFAVAIFEVFVLCLWATRALTYSSAQPKSESKLARPEINSIQEEPPDVPTTHKDQELSQSAAKPVIFIGHGHASDWLELARFIRDRLQLPYDEFNASSAAGLGVQDRLSAMLGKASFAFLVMTAEDEHTDETLHARENVIHEAGLFQGKLGFRKAILLLENKCKPFSNVYGLGYIRFERGHIKATFDEIRQVLEREEIL